MYKTTQKWVKVLREWLPATTWQGQDRHNLGWRRYLSIWDVCSEITVDNYHVTADRISALCQMQQWKMTDDGFLRSGVAQVLCQNVLFGLRGPRRKSDHFSRVHVSCLPVTPHDNISDGSTYSRQKSATSGNSFVILDETPKHLQNVSWSRADVHKSSTSGKKHLSGNRIQLWM